MCICLLNWGLLFARDDGAKWKPAKEKRSWVNRFRRVVLVWAAGKEMDGREDMSLEREWGCGATSGESSTVIG